MNANNALAVGRVTQSSKRGSLRQTLPDAGVAVDWDLYGDSSSPRGTERLFCVDRRFSLHGAKPLQCKNAPCGAFSLAQYYARY